MRHPDRRRGDLERGLTDVTAVRLLFYRTLNAAEWDKVGLLGGLVVLDSPRPLQSPASQVWEAAGSFCTAHPMARAASSTSSSTRQVGDCRMPH